MTLQTWCIKANLFLSAFVILFVNLCLPLNITHFGDEFYLNIKWFLLLQ